MGRIEMWRAIIGVVVFCTISGTAAQAQDALPPKAQLESRCGILELPWCTLALLQEISSKTTKTNDALTATNTKLDTLISKMGSGPDKPIFTVSKAAVGKPFFDYRCSGPAGNPDDPSCGKADVEKFCNDAGGTLLYFTGTKTGAQAAWRMHTLDYVACRLR